MQSTSIEKKTLILPKWMSRSNLTTLIMVLCLGILFFSPESKAWIIQQMMKVGFFQPEMSQNALLPLETAAPLVFEDGKGNKINISEQKGKVIFINFWATWCGPCVAELPSIGKLYESYKGNDKIMFLMVDTDGDHPKAQKFMDGKHLSLPVVIPAGPIPSNMLGNSIPCTVVIDKEGKMAFRHEGTADYSSKKFKQALEKLLKE